MSAATNEAKARRLAELLRRIAARHLAAAKATSPQGRGAE